MVGKRFHICVCDLQENGIYDVDNRNDFDAARRPGLKAQRRDRMWRVLDVVPCDIEESHVEPVDPVLLQVLQNLRRGGPLGFPVVERTVRRSIGQTVRPEEGQQHKATQENPAERQAPAAQELCTSQKHKFRFEH